MRYSVLMVAVVPAALAVQATPAAAQNSSTGWEEVQLPPVFGSTVLNDGCTSVTLKRSANRPLSLAAGTLNHIEVLAHGVDLNNLQPRITGISGETFTQIQRFNGFQNVGRRCGAIGSMRMMIRIPDGVAAGTTGHLRIGSGIVIPVTTTARRPTPPPSSGGSGSPRRNPPTFGAAANPDLLPVFGGNTQQLIRRIGGLGPNVMIPITFCSRLGLNQASTVPVPDLVWGVSSARAAASSVRVQLKDMASGAVLSAFDSGALAANSAAVTRSNYPGRPATLRVVNVTGGATMQQYGNQAGCFLDRNAPAQRLDPALNQLRLEVDAAAAVDEGKDGEANNGLQI